MLEGAEGDGRADVALRLQRGRCGPRGRRAAALPDLKTVYFDFDSAAIRDDARTDAARPTPRRSTSHSEWKTVTLEGHTDERGTEEYNLALGERRANAVKRYLDDLGVPTGA